MLKLGTHKTFKGKKLYREVWKDVVGYEGLYQVSNLGRVKSFQKKSAIILKQSLTNKGYKDVRLNKKGICKHKLIHRLIAEAFIPNPENKPFIDHINTVKTDNSIKNLRWTTRTENNNNELTRKHSSETRKGKVLSEETKKKMRKSSKKRRKVICVETGIIYNSVSEAEAQTNATLTGIVKCCTKVRKTSGGFHWAYI